MADLPALIQNLLQDVADSHGKRLTEEKTLSFIVAKMLFDQPFITLKTFSHLYTAHFHKQATEGQLIEVLKKPDLLRICLLTFRGDVPIICPSKTLSKALNLRHTIETTESQRVTNGTDISDYSNKNNNNMTEADRIARMLSDELTCVVCMDTLTNAVDSSCCKVLCCSACAQKCANCPMCRTSNIKWTANEPIRRIVGKRPAKCLNNGCSLWSTAAEISIHKEKCEHRLVSCTNKGCAEKMKLSELKVHTTTRCKFKFAVCKLCQKQVPGTHSHRKCVFECGELLCDNTAKPHNGTCGYRPVQCAQCGQSVQKQHMENHLQHECQYRMLTHGNCRVRVFAKEINEHINSCPEAHVRCRYCNDICLRKNHSRHESGCPQRPQYRCEDCSEWYLDNDGHEDTCPERWVDCPNRNCRGQVKAWYLDEHVDNVCQFTQYHCRHCNKVVFRHQLFVHEEQQCPHRFDY